MTRERTARGIVGILFFSHGTATLVMLLLFMENSLFTKTRRAKEWLVACRNNGCQARQVETSYQYDRHN